MINKKKYSLETIASQLENHPDYKVLKRLKIKDKYNPDDGSNIYTGRSEMTGTSLPRQNTISNSQN